MRLLLFSVSLSFLLCVFAVVLSFDCISHIQLYQANMIVTTTVVYYVLPGTSLLTGRQRNEVVSQVELIEVECGGIELL